MLMPDELEHLISPARFSTFVDLSWGDRMVATKLYEWTGRLAGALFTDFRHLEIVFRNKVDQALMEYARTHDPDVMSWLDDSWLPDHTNGWDDEANKAIGKAREMARGRNPSHDAVIAQLMFGFWRYATKGRYEEAFWLPALDGVFTNIPGANAVERRVTLETAMINLNKLRNRIAHHEPICKPWKRRTQGGVELVLSVDDVYRDLEDVLRWCDPSSSVHFLKQSRVPELLATRPS